MSTTESHPRCRFALLGATGNTGRLVLKRLLGEPNTELHVYARSRSKLEGMFPSLSSNPQVTVFEGSLDEKQLFYQCLSGAETIICTLGENENIPGIRVLQDAARVILSALSSLRDDAATASPSVSWTRPRLIFLSSATWSETFAAAQPRLLHWMIENAFARPYHDLVQAQAMLKSEPTLLDLVLVQPNALVIEPASGCIVSTEFAHMAVSYEDLAEGFVRIATWPEYKDVGAIGVSSERAANPLLYIPFVIGKVVRGLLFQFVPGYWQAEYAISRWLS